VDGAMSKTQAIPTLQGVPSSDVPFQGDDPQDKGLGELLRLLWERKTLFFALFVLTSAAAFGLIAALPRAYTSSALLVLDPRETHYADLPQVVTIASQTPELNLNLVRSEIEVLKSDELARRVVEALNLENDPTFMRSGLGISQLTSLLPWHEDPVVTEESKLEAATLRYEKALDFFNDGKSFVISAKFTAATPMLAQRVLSKHIELYLADQRAFKQTAILRAKDWLIPELKRLETKLHGAEADLQAYRGSHHLTAVGGETIDGRLLAALTAQLAEARADLETKVSRQAELHDGKQDTQQLGSQTLSRLRDQEAATAQQWSDMRSRYGERSPFMTASAAKLADIRQKIADELSRMQTAADQDTVMARETAQRLTQQVVQLEQQVVDAGSDDLVAVGLQREVDAQRKLYDDLLSRSMQVSAQYEIQDADIRVVSAPLALQQPSFPRYGLLGVVAAFAAAVLSAGVVFVLERLRSGSQNLGNIERSVGLPGLGSIPRLRIGRRTPWPPMLEPLTQPAAAVQSLVNSIRFQVAGNSPKVLAIVSALPGEGKTTVAALVATSLAQDGARVLLVDADFRRRGLSRRMRLTTSNGLVGLLETGGSLAEAAAHDARTGLDVLTAERPATNPSRLARAEIVARVLTEARAAYDAVIIDTPPLAAVDDALPFAAAADATILVALWGATPMPALRGCLQRLRLAGSQNVGVALNGVRGRGQASQPGFESVRALPRIYFGAGAGGTGAP
jgi:polysaccharide biosynthesis transport protein